MTSLFITLLVSIGAIAYASWKTYTTARKRQWGRTYLALVAVFGICFVTSAVLSWGVVTQHLSTDIRKDNIGGDFTLTDGDGKPFALSSLKGKVVVLSFGYTHCPDICPTELLTYNDTLKQLGDEAKNVAVVFVSVDPDRDTPELMKQYVKQFNPAFIGLTDTQGGNEIALAKQQWRIISAKADIKSEKLYNVDHSSGTYLLDKQGNAAYFERFGAEAPQIAADIKKLLAE